MPIVNAINDILTKKANINEVIKNLNPEKSTSGGVFTLNLGLLILLLGWRGFVTRSKRVK